MPYSQKSLAEDVVEEWASFLPLTGDNLDPGTMLSNFNVLLATASCLLTQKNSAIYQVVSLRQSFCQRMLENLIILDRLLQRILSKLEFK